MVACDSKNCSIEWFHLNCVGLDEVPDDSTKWYCPNCRMMKWIKIVVTKSNLTPQLKI